MTSIDFPGLMTHVFVLVDDWIDHNWVPSIPPRPGPKPRFSDSEVLTLALLMDYLPFPGETQFIQFVRANYLDWFPNLLDVSQFNRRLRRLRPQIERLRRAWMQPLLQGTETQFCLDTKPIPVVGVKRSKRHSDFEGSANYGYCAARRLYSFGYKLTLLSSLEGVPIAFDLMPGNTDERQGTEGILDQVRHSVVYADKGFVGEEWQAQLRRETGNQILTPARANQVSPVSAVEQRCRNGCRQRIEGVFHELQNTGRSLERLLNKTVEGWMTHISLKVASHSLRLLLRRQFAIDVLTFSTL